MCKKSIVNLIAFIFVSCLKIYGETVLNTENHYVIVGASAAGVSAALRLRQLDKDASITCLAKEKEEPYKKTKLKSLLKKALKGEPSKDITFFSKIEAKKKNINLILGVEVLSIDEKNKQIILSDKSTVVFDKLLLATGASEVKHEMLSKIDGVFYYRDLLAVNSMLNFVEKENVKSAVVVGTGLAGMECANALLKGGIKTTIITSGDHVMSSRIDSEGAKLIESYIAKKNASVIKNASIKNIVEDKEKGQLKIYFNDEKTLDTGMVVFAGKTKPNTDIVKNTNIKTHENLGCVLVNEYLQTNNQDIYAAGDVVCLKDEYHDGAYVRSGKWNESEEQGKIAAENMYRKKDIYKGEAPNSMTNVFGLKIGIKEPTSKNDVNFPKALNETVLNGENYYYKLITNKDNIAKGYIFIGDEKKRAWEIRLGTSKAKKAIRNKKIFDLKKILGASNFFTFIFKMIVI